MSLLQMAHIPAPYTPVSDAMDRHDYGVTKSRKPNSSTGGGRAWSEDEEAYLLQTRMQKMPYKHIAAHLKKTELACRLHYHQLSHGSSRRKRTASVSSGSSPGQSPVMHPSFPSPVHERSVSPHGYVPASPSLHVRLPSLADHCHMAGPGPRLPAILPKPNPTMPSAPRTASPFPAFPGPARGPPATLAPAHFPRLSPRGGRYPAHDAAAAAAQLQVDCSAPPAPGYRGSPPHTHVDMARLDAVYATHRASFWATIASEYGSGAAPLALEHAFRSGSCCPQTATPITPVSSPDGAVYERSLGAAAPAPPTSRGSDKTRISAILGVDADPRSPSEREMVRRLEQERSWIG